MLRVVAPLATLMMVRFTAGRTQVPPDGGCFVAGRGWVHCQARTRPSGRQLFRSRQGLGSLPGAHTSIRMEAVL